MSTKLKHRVARLFHRNKVTALEETFRGQILHGRRRTWHRNGQLATEEFYADGLLHGVVRQWNEQGSLLGSFRMEHGTGTQKSWHGNGRLNQEFSTVAGKFCGRSRMWLRDGTLISDQILLFNQNVSPGQYRRAAAKDPRLPRLRGRIGKPPPNNQAMQNHIHRVFVSSLLSGRNRSEARVWLQADDQTGLSLGRFKRLAEAMKFVGELYQAGAIEVILPDIYRNKRGDQFADSLLVKLPQAAKQRKVIRTVCANLQKKNLGSFAPDKDTGESHLYLLLA
jgi:hypothetical protein